METGTLKKTKYRINFTGRTSSHTVKEMRGRKAIRESVDLEQAVHLYYKDVYRFAYHLAKNAADASDLTQFAYERLTMKHEQIEEPAKVKSWLQSTVYRKFIDQKRHVTRFPKVEFNEDHPEAKTVSQASASRLDSQTALEALHELEEDLRAPLVLFYLESCSYKEIAKTLDIPVGTVMSRLHRGKERLYHSLAKVSS